MTAEPSRKVDPADDFDAYGPPGSSSPASRFSATPPDTANMAALLKSIMERMERSERQTSTALQEMQARLAEIKAQAEVAASAAEKAEEAERAMALARPASPEKNASPPASAGEHSAFAMLEQRLSDFQIPASEPRAETSSSPLRLQLFEARLTDAEAAQSPDTAPAAMREPQAANPSPESAERVQSSVTKPFEPRPERRIYPQPPEPAAEKEASYGHVMSAAAEPPPIIERRRERSWEDRPATDRRGEDRCRFEDQFEALTVRLEGALAATGPNAGIDALSEKLDVISRELAEALAEPAQALTSIEHQLGGIARSFGQTDQRFQKMDAIEAQIAKLAAALDEAPDAMSRLAEDAASRAIERTRANSADNKIAMRLDSMHAELTAFDGRARAQADRLSEMVDGIEKMLSQAVEQKRLKARSQPGSVSQERPTQPEPRVPEFPDIQRILAGGGKDASLEDEEKSGDFHLPPPEHAEQRTTLRERLGASIPDYQKPHDQKTQPAAHADHPASAQPQPDRTPEKDDFVAAARRAAQAAAQRANDIAKPAQTRKSALKPEKLAKAAEAQLTRPRPTLVIAAAILLIASAALLYSRLQSRPTAPQPPAVEQQQPAEDNDPAKSSNSEPGSRGETMLARGLRALQGPRDPKNIVDRIEGEVQPASVRPSDPGIARAPGESVVAKSLGDDATAIEGQLQLPPAAIGPYSMRLAAARGEAAAQHEVGSRYAEGKNVDQSWEEASRWYARAAAQGFAPAQYRLAVLYERGQGVEKDGARARIWYTRAAEQGNVKSMHNLAVTMAGQNATPEDYANAAQWFAKAAELGLADSQFNLAIFFENGLGVERDLVEAYKWYALAANQMDVEAAKRREALKAQLEPQVLMDADKAVKAWRPVGKNKSANEVEAGAWSETAAEL